MKLTTLIVLAFCNIALANTYPKFTSASNLLVQSEVIRFRIAPFYGETLANTISVENVRTVFTQYSIDNLTENVSNRLIADVPQFSKYKLGNQKQIIQIATVDGKQVSTTRNLAEIATVDGKQVSTRNFAEIATVDTPDPFFITRNFAEIATVDGKQVSTTRNLAEIATVDGKQVSITRNLAGIATVDTPDPFSIRLEFDWVEPHGQWMNQLLTDIKAAKAAGDTETYKKLTAQYQAWADVYLIKGSPIRVMK
jgi:hypothetical protein